MLVVSELEVLLDAFSETPALSIVLRFGGVNQNRFNVVEHLRMRGMLPVRQQGQPETVPSIYNRKSTLSQEVRPELARPVDFELTSQNDGRTVSK